jgi:hypothetical protein
MRIAFAELVHSPLGHRPFQPRFRLRRRDNVTEKQYRRLSTVERVAFLFHQGKALNNISGYNW